MVEQINPERTRIAVIGAGMAGLACAARLSARPNLDVVVYEEQATPGGRLAGRRESRGAFDSGAQFLTCHDTAFAAEIDRLRDAGVLHSWLGRFCRMQNGEIKLQNQDLIHDRFLGTGSMSAITDYMATGLDIRPLHRLVEISRNKDNGPRWTLTLATDTAFVEDRVDMVLLALPGPVAADFLSPVPGLRLTAHKAEYSACWSLMVTFDEQPETSFEALSMERARHVRASLPAQVSNSECGWPNAWICRETGKAGRPTDRERWVLHAAPEYSNARLHAEPQQVAEDMLAGFRAVLPRARLNPTWKKAVLYRYARVSKPAGEDCLFNGDMAIGAAGDWCIGPSAERAWLSGTALAQRVLEDLAIRGNDNGFGGMSSGKSNTTSGTWRDWLR